MPNFANLFNLNINFNLPTIDFSLDLPLFDLVFNFNFGCAVDVKNACSAVSGAVSFDCGNAYGKRSL